MGQLNARWVVNAIDEYDYLMQGFGTRGCMVASHVTHDIHVGYSFMEGQLRAIASFINLEGRGAAVHVA